MKFFKKAVVLTFGLAATLSISSCGGAANKGTGSATAVPPGTASAKQPVTQSNLSAITGTYTVQLVDSGNSNPGTHTVSFVIGTTVVSGTTYLTMSAMCLDDPNYISFSAQQLQWSVQPGSGADAILQLDTFEGGSNQQLSSPDVNNGMPYQFEFDMALTNGTTFDSTQSSIVIREACGLSQSSQCQVDTFDVQAQGALIGRN